jgi:hypothetical protein
MLGLMNVAVGNEREPLETNVVEDPFLMEDLREAIARVVPGI